MGVRSCRSSIRKQKAPNPGGKGSASHGGGEKGSAWCHSWEGRKEEGIIAKCEMEKNCFLKKRGARESSGEKVRLPNKKKSEKRNFLCGKGRGGEPGEKTA